MFQLHISVAEVLHIFLETVPWAVREQLKRHVIKQTIVRYNFHTDGLMSSLRNIVPTLNFKCSFLFHIQALFLYYKVQKVGDLFTLQNIFNKF